MRNKLAHRLVFLLYIYILPAFLFANPLVGMVGKIVPGSNYVFTDIVPQPITICSGAPIVIRGDAATPVPDSYSWEVLQGTTWLNAPGVNNTSDYTASLLINNTTSDVLFSIRRKITTAGVVTYDSYFDVTVQPATPISNNAINTPAINSFCGTGNPATITGSAPLGGNGTFTYQWQSSTDNITFSNITGATGSTYTPPAITATTYYRRAVTSTSCTTPSLSNTVGIVIVQQVGSNVITAPAITVFCSSTDPAIITGNTPSGGDGNYSYQWQSSTDNITFTNIAGITTRDYDPPLVSTTTYFRRYAISGICSTPVFSNVVTISLLPLLTNNNISAPLVNLFCTAGDANLITGNTPSGGSGTYTYQWQSSTDSTTFIDISGATLKDYDPPLAVNTIYYRRLTTSGPCSTPLVSNNITISILPIPAVPLLSQATATICSGGTATFSVSSSQAGLTYNWYDSVAKTTLLFSGTSYTTPVQSTSKTYYVESYNGTCASATLTTAQVVIATPILLLNNNINAPAVNSFCAPSDPSTITGSLPGGGNGSYSYQWQSSADNMTYTDIPGAVSVDYDPSLVSVTTYYRRTVTSPGSCAVPLLSNVITIAILPAITNNTLTLPAVASFCVAGDPAIIAGSIPSGGSNVYSYQWQQSTDNVNFTDITGAASKDYDPAIISTTTYYRRVVTSGQCTAPVISNTATMVILGLPATPVPSLTSVTVCPGTVAVLSVSSPQSGLTYNWYNSASKSSLLFTGTTYTTGLQTTSNAIYVESSNGSCSSSPLVPVQVNVSSITAPLVVTNNVSICINSVAVLSVAGPQPGFIYNWYSLPTGGTSLYTGADFTTPALLANTTYYVEAINTGGCNSTTRTPVNVIVAPLPRVTALGTSVCMGSGATLTANADVANATINWYTTATGGSPVYTGSTFITPAITTPTSYYAEAVNATGCVSSARVQVQIDLLQPLNAPLVTAGVATTNSVTFNWEAVSGAAAYQVSTDNGLTYTNPSSGSTGLTHTVSGLKENQSVSIIVKAIGASGCQLSNNLVAVTAKTQTPADGVFVANAFTPNGDGNNDVLYVHSENIKTMSFYVYDQWGEKIYGSTNMANGWDGTYKGVKEPAGVYVYYLKAVLNNGTEVNKKGTITLLR